MVHALRGECFGAFGQCLGSRFDGGRVAMQTRRADVSHQAVNLRSLIGAEQIRVSNQRALASPEPNGQVPRVLTASLKA